MSPITQRQAEFMHAIADLLERLGWGLILFTAGFWIFELARAYARGVLIP